MIPLFLTVIPQVLESALLRKILSEDLGLGMVGAI